MKLEVLSRHLLTTKNELSNSGQHGEDNYIESDDSPHSVEMNGIDPTVSLTEKPINGMPLLQEEDSTQLDRNGSQETEAYELR